MCDPITGRTIPPRGTAEAAQCAGRAARAAHQARARRPLPHQADARAPRAALRAVAYYRVGHVFHNTSIVYELTRVSEKAGRQKNLMLRHSV